VTGAVQVACPDGAVLVAQTEGIGPDLLLVSGLGGTAEFWNPVAAHWVKRFRVMRFDQRGIGASSRGTASCTINQLAEDCLRVLNAVGSRQAIMLGHSTGGCILQTLALRAPDRLAALVLSGAWARPSRYLVELFAARWRLLDLSPREYAAITAFLSYTPAWIEENWSQVAAGLSRAPESIEARKVLAERIEALTTFDRSAEIGRIKIPTLVIGAEDDQIVPAFMQRDLASLIPGAELRLLPSGAHFFPVTRTEAFTAAVESWLGRLTS
jgi:aminoacrylate hydrolase